MQVVTEKVIFSPLDDLFSDIEVANLLGDPPPPVRRALVARAVKAGEILKVKRGFYFLAKKYRRPERTPDPFGVANRLYKPSYLSHVSVLAEHHLIPDVLQKTVVSGTTRRTAEFKTPLGVFQYLSSPFKTYQSVGLSKLGNGSYYKAASPLRALAEVQHHGKEKMDLRFLEHSMRIESDELEEFVTTDELDLLLEDLKGSKSRAVWFLRNLKKEMGK